MNKVRLAISGMTCEHCARTVERALRSAEGVASVSVSYAEGRAEADVAERVSEESLVKSVERAGYGARILGGNP